MGSKFNAFILLLIFLILSGCGATASTNEKETSQEGSVKEEQREEKKEIERIIDPYKLEQEDVYTTDSITDGNMKIAIDTDNKIISYSINMITGSMMKSIIKDREVISKDEQVNSFTKPEGYYLEGTHFYNDKIYLYYGNGQKSIVYQVNIDSNGDFKEVETVFDSEDHGEFSSIGFIKATSNGPAILIQDRSLDKIKFKLITLEDGKELNFQDKFKVIGPDIIYIDIPTKRLFFQPEKFKMSVLDMNTGELIYENGREKTVELDAYYSEGLGKLDDNHFYTINTGDVDLSPEKTIKVFDLNLNEISSIEFLIEDAGISDIQITGTHIIVYDAMIYDPEGIEPKSIFKVYKFKRGVEVNEEDGTSVTTTIQKETEVFSQEPSSNENLPILSLENNQPLKNAKSFKNGEEDKEIPIKLQDGKATIYFGQDHPNGMKIHLVKGDVGIPIYLEQVNDEILDEFGEFVDYEGFSLTVGTYDFNHDKNEEIIITIGDDLLTGQVWIYSYHEVDDNSKINPFYMEMTASYQREIWIGKDKILIPYGSQGLFDEYVWYEDGFLKK